MAQKKTNTPLEQNPYVKELLDVLKKHNSPGAEELRGMIANTVKIEQQLAAAVEELTAMRRELAAIREDNNPMRNILQSAINAMQEQIRALSRQLETLKTNIIEGCKNTLAAFKERGAAALNDMAKFFKVKPALEAIAKICDDGIKDNTKTINKIERISREYHKAGRHIKNIGRAVMGKELITSAKPVGKVAKAVEAPVKAARACNRAMRDAARKAARSLTRLEKAAERPKPIQEQLNAAAKQAAAHNARNAQGRAKEAPAAEL
jgi:cob(I)alamin adenosyltransferase